MINYDTYDWADCEQPKDYCESIYQFVKDHQFKVGLEVGFDSGSSALAFLVASPNGHLTTVDLLQLPKAEALLEKHGVWGRCEFIQGDSALVLPAVSNLKRLFDYIFIDGDHLYKGVKEDLKNALSLMALGGYILCDDYVENGKFGVKKAVDELLASDGSWQAQTLANCHNTCILWKKV